MGEEGKPPHLLRGEDATHHIWTWSIAQEKLPSTKLAVRGHGLQMTVGGDLSDIHHWPLPLDADISHFDAHTTKDGKLILQMLKKPHTDSPEDLARMRVEAAADNRMVEVNVQQPS